MRRSTRPNSNTRRPRRPPSRRSTLTELTLTSVVHYVATNIPETTPDIIQRSSTFITTGTGTPVLSTSTTDANSTTDTNATRRRRKRRRGKEQLKNNNKKRTARKRSQLEKSRLELDKVNALRDRILQHKKGDGSLPDNLRQMLNTVQKQANC